MSGRFEHTGSDRPPAIRLHDLRHTCATLPLTKRIPVHVVAEWLGHRNATITLRVYSHVLPHSQDDATAIGDLI